MENSPYYPSYLYSTKRKLRSQINKMEKRKNSDISLDSLEAEFNKNLSLKKKDVEDNVETILVPFYEKDVLIKVSKDNRKRNKSKSKEKPKIDPTPHCSYLINKNKTRSSYLERFRKQYDESHGFKVVDDNEIRSISPQFGDTERESIGDVSHNTNIKDFFNSEAYNEIYYEKLLTQDMENDIQNSTDEDVRFSEDIRSKSPDSDNNLKSVSEVSRPRRQMRRATYQPLQNVKLGGLGPDLQKIKPTLERTRSLQRYSEKVRMENRLKIYRQNVQTEMEKKTEKVISIRKQSASSSKSKTKEDKASYLVNSMDPEIYKSKTAIPKSKSDNSDKKREQEQKNKPKQTKSRYSKKNNESVARIQSQSEGNVGAGEEISTNRSKVGHVTRIKSSSINRTVNVDVKANDASMSPVKINFVVNVGGMRPSSALKKLEEKHRMYQERVKAFIRDNNEV